MALTNADLDAWKDPDATLEHWDKPSDPSQHSCMYHPGDHTVPCTVTVRTWHHMVGSSCQPCGEAILAALHGTPWDQTGQPRVVLAAAKLSVFMARTLGQHDATVTELHPRGDE